jgi:hypothetical protein
MTLPADPQSPAGQVCKLAKPLAPVRPDFVVGGVMRRRDLRLLEWHNRGMNRIRLSTTVDADLLGSARNARSGITDAALIDEALAALLARYRSAEVDAGYAAYDEHPVEEPDEWGDLASWRRAAGAS